MQKSSTVLISKTLAISLARSVPIPFKNSMEVSNVNGEFTSQ